jgi:putative peptidoglycan lipid II flippase
MKLYRAFATVGGLTLMSRMLGFVRDILIAAGLGTGAVADAYVVAFRFPNLFRRLFGEGAFNAAFVPLFAKRHEGDGEAAARDFAEEALAVLLVAVALFSFAAILAMPWLMVVIAPGFIDNPDKYALAVALTQIAFPYLLCMSVVALLSGVLNSLHRFWAAAAAPILLNVVLVIAITIALALGFARRPEAGFILAAGVSIAGIAQLAMLWVAIRRAGIVLRLRRPRITPGVKRLVTLGIPGVIAGGITQINIVVSTIIASLHAGAVSYLYYSDRLYQLPLGIVGVAVGVVLLPELSRTLRSGDRAAALDAQNRSLEFAVLLTLPAAVALAVSAEPIVRVLFERGAFGAADTFATAAAVRAIAFGLPAFVMLKVLQPAFFAREDTRTPLRFAAVNMAIDVAGGVSLFFLFAWLDWRPYVGIPIATAIAGWANALLLWRALKRSGEFSADARLARNLVLIALASIAMAACLFWSEGWLAPYLVPTQGVVTQGLALALLLGAGAIVYAAVIVGTGVLRPVQVGRFLGGSVKS